MMNNAELRYGYTIKHTERAASIPLRRELLNFFTRGRKGVGDSKPTTVKWGEPVPMCKEVAEMTESELSQPTRYLPGTNQKIDVMTRRAALGMCIFLPGDAPLRRD